MDPIAFEALVADLFRAMGMQAVTTQRSNDGGVDVDALDPTPIRGGKIVVQVKRYRNTVPPTAVRDLYGTVQDAGANKGVLVTTSAFGPGSHTFANGKPLELVAGSELVDLLHRHGLRGRLGNGERSVPAQRPASDSEPGTDDHNVLGMYWSGNVALDVCALICQGNRVLDDDHFVFFNNPRTPDGTVRALIPVTPDRAAIQVSFDALPTRADRLVIIAAVDPVANSAADLSGFTDAGIRLLDAERTPLDQLEVPDGRTGETALVLGSFHRRANGDWEFVSGGKGYPGGLEELVQEYGIDMTRERVSLSLKALQEDPMQELVQHVGRIVTGLVTKLAPFGAFVRIEDRDDGFEGLVHISELSARHVERPEDVVQVGDTLAVMILLVDPTRRQILLSHKQALAGDGVGPSDPH